MKYFVLASIFILFGLQAGCTKKPSDDLAPTSLAGKILEGRRTSGTGAFAGDESYTFVTRFDAMRHFEIKTTAGVLENNGDFQYQKTGHNIGLLTLSAKSGVRSGDDLQITLKFTSPGDGAYEAQLIKGEQGDQTGVFKLK